MGISLGVASVALGAYSAKNQRDIGKKALKGSARIRNEQDYYNDLLKELLTNPSEILKDPGYDFAFGQGIEAVERSNAARGFTGSGNAAIDLQKYGQSFASSFLQQRENLLAGLSGLQASESPSAGLGVAVSANNSSTDILSSTLASLGYTFGKGGVGRGGGFGGASAGTPAAQAAAAGVS